MKHRVTMMMLALLSSMAAWSADGDTFTEESNGIMLTYTIVSESDKTCETAAQTSLPVDAAIVIPSSANGYKVIGIGYRSFRNFAIKSISFPSGLRYIDEEAFEGCSHLTGTLTIPNTVTYISRQAFKDCSMTNVRLLGGVKTVGTEAFRDCTSLTQVSMGIGVTTIGDSMFSGCTNLASIYFPSTITTIGTNAFSGTAWYKNLPEGMTYIGTIAFRYINVTGSTTVTINDGTTSIFRSAFYKSDVTSVTIPSSVTSIGERAFQDCYNLSTIKRAGSSSTWSVWLFDTVNEIGDYVFSGCSSITSVYLPSSLVAISDDLFWNCTSLTNVFIPNSLERIGSSAVSGCSNLATLSIPSGVTSIGSAAFCGCVKLTTINIPQGVTAIGQMTFEGCKGLTSVKLHEGITSIGIRAFSGCTSLTEITIPGTLRTMETWDNCWAFSSCTGLKKITINKGAALLGANTFQGCSNVETVVCWNEEPISVNGSFTSFASNATLYVPAGCTAAYAEASYWKDFKSIVEMPDNVISFKDSEVRDICISNWDTNGDGFLSTDEAAAVTDIGSAFKSKSKIRRFDELSYFTGITAIPKEAFSSCTALISITIPENVTNINYEAFSSCSSLASIKLPTALTEIGEKAFEYCSSLTSIDIPGSVETIGPRAFRGCKGFVTMVIPNGVKNLGAGVFRECTNLAFVSFPGSVTSIGIEFFKDCPALEALTVDDNNATFESPQGSNAIIEKASKTLVLGCKTTVVPADVEHIGEYAFINCTGLTSIVFPDGLTSIELKAFQSCTALTSITLPANVSSIGKDAFSVCSGLTYITALRETPAELSKSVFPTTSNITLYVPAGCKDAYQTAWGTFKEIVELTDGASFVVSYPFGNITYKILSNTDLTCEVSYSWSLTGEVVIPSSVNGYRVIGIGALAFEEEEDFTSIVIPSSITYMRDRAFRRTYPESVYISDLEAWCNIDFDGTISNPINGCNLYVNGELVTDLVIPNSITAIKPYAFCYCKSITSVTLHENVVSIGEAAFAGISGLTSVTVGASEPVAITSDVFTNQANATLYVPAGSRAAYKAADNWKEFKNIFEMTPPGVIISFADANVKALCVAEWDTNGDGELSEAEAAAVTDLGQVFEYNTSIKSFDELQYFTGLTSIAAFFSCKNLSSVVLPNSVTSIGGYAFCDCKGLSSLIIPNSVTSIGESAFDGCSGLTSLTIPNSVTRIEYYAFSGCTGLTSITIPNGVIFIDESTFESCWNLTSVTIPNSVVSIGNTAFSDCSSLTSITIPNSVTNIGNQAFSGCSSLASVTIPNSVFVIGDYAFSGCDNLTSVTVGASEPVEITADVFSNSSNATLYVPVGSKAAYEAADYWKDFMEIVETIVMYSDTDISQIDNAVYVNPTTGGRGSTATLEV